MTRNIQIKIAHRFMSHLSYPKKRGMAQCEHPSPVHLHFAAEINSSVHPSDPFHGELCTKWNINGYVATAIIGFRSERWST